MQTNLRTYFSYFLAVSLVAAPLQLAAANSKNFDPIISQYLTDKVLDQTFAATEKIKNQQDMLNTLAQHYTQADLKAVQAQLKKIHKFPKLSRLNRGFAYDYGGRHYEFVIDDIANLRFTVNRKFKWSYRQNSPLSVQLEVLNRGLQSEKTAAFDWLLNRAHADGGTTIIIGILIAGLVVPLISDVTNTYILPTFKGWFCSDKDPNNFNTYKYCEEYFKHQASVRPKVPSAKPVTEEHQPEVFQMEKKCSKTNDPDFWVQFEGESGVTLRRTIKYDQNKKPKQMIEEQIKPTHGSPKIFTLRGDGELLKVTDDKGLFLSRDKEDAELMNPEKFEQMKAYDKAIETTIGFIKTCDESVATDISLKATQPGYLTAGELASKRAARKTQLTTMPDSSTSK